MNLRNRIDSLVSLGDYLQAHIDPFKTEGIPLGNLKEAVYQAHELNPWFTPTQTFKALAHWANLLTHKNLTSWLKPYSLSKNPDCKNIQVISAGNIPMVGFHDFLSVLISGHRYNGKLSSRDGVLMPFIAEVMKELTPEWENLINFSDTLLKEPDAVIATGNSNSALFFADRYNEVPHIIRTNRSSIAILSDQASYKDLSGLAEDILNFYGLGCRSISKVWYSRINKIKELIKILKSNIAVLECQEYADNLRHARALYTLLEIPYYNADSLLLVHDSDLHSPIGVVHLQKYSNTDEAVAESISLNNQIQCISCDQRLTNNVLPMGTLQYPSLSDFADEIDTIDFLLKLDTP